LLAHKQLALGATGVCCQKVGEAEVMVAAGVGDVLVANEVVGQEKSRRLAALAHHARVTVAVDHPENARAHASAARRDGVEIGVLVDLDVGQRRCGVEAGKPALELARLVASLPGLRLRGLQAYAGHHQHLVGFEARREAETRALDRVAETKAMLEAEGIPVEVVSAGGTGTYNITGLHPVVSEVQAGSYIFMDAQYRAVGGKAGPAFEDFECALTVLTTVMSTPGRGWAVVDAGHKAVTTDAGMPLVKGEGGVRYQPAGDEHGRLLLENPRREFKLGDKLELIPSHGCTTINLYDFYHALRGGRLEAIWRVAARGRTQ
ncbi:MAG: DSD1 family PLP-dependent enzyme, partial [Nitrospinota bacterium]